MVHDQSTTLATILEKVRALGPVLRERAVEAERTGRHSTQTIADLDATGAFNIGSPAEYGGYELTVRQQLEYDSILADFTERTTTFKETHPDYDQHVASTDKILTDAGLGLLPVMADAIVRSAHSAEISYWLATHPSEYLQLVQDLRSLDITAAPMVRRLLEKEAVSAGASRGAAPTAQVSHAKPPIKPLGASAVTTDDPPGDEASAAQHARYWNRKLKVPGSQAS